MTYEGEFCVVFDLDGTLVNTAPIIKKIIMLMIYKRGGSYNKLKNIDYFFQIGGKKLMHAAFKDLGYKKNEDLKEFRNILNKTFIPPQYIYLGIKDLLFNLKKRGISMAVCSNKPTKLSIKTLDNVGLLSYFKFVQGSEIDLEKKPQTDLLFKLSNNLNSRNLVLIGDGEVDQETAHNFRIDYIHLGHGYGELNSKLRLPVANYDILNKTNNSSLIKILENRM